MRILVKLKCLSNNKYDNNHIYHLHSFLYGLLKDTYYDYLHDYSGRKYFTYTNLFPPKDFQINNIYNLVFSTPDIHLGEIIYKGLYTFLERQIDINNMRFVILSVRILSIHLKPSDKIETATPIVLKDNGSYWGYRNGDQDISNFISLLNNSMVKKYNKYHNNKFKFNLLDCIENIYFKQITAVTLNLKNNKNTIIGSKWKFKIKKDITPLNMKFIQFNFDSGFGQKTAMGFGCMNRILNKEKKHVQIKHKTKV